MEDNTCEADIKNNIDRIMYVITVNGRKKSERYYNNDLIKR